MSPTNVFRLDSQLFAMATSAAQSIAPIAGRGRALSSDRDETARSSLLALGAEENRDALAAIEPLESRRGYHRGEQIYGPGDPADRWYRMISGLARKFALLADGRRPILDFLLPGDLFGLSTRTVREMAVDAAVEDTMVANYPRRAAEQLADRDPRFAAWIRDLAFDSIWHLEVRSLILGRMTAVERVRLFLLEMVSRSSAQQSDVVVLSMSRYDIADYLALSVETVSRALTKLQQGGVIRLMDSHRVKFAISRSTSKT